MNCLNCSKKTKNPKFCSSSCSATLNNKTFPKRFLSNTCKSCEVKINSNRSYCKPCWDSQQSDWSIVTIAEMRGRRNHQKHSAIRILARAAYRKAQRPQKCYNCGYDKHIEICHILAIKNFPVTTTIAEVNKQENLIGLCPNCHWELDNDQLVLTTAP